MTLKDKPGIKKFVLLFLLSGLVFLAGMNSSFIEKFYSDGFYQAISVAQRFLSSIFPFALGDFLYLLLVLYALRSIYLFFRKLSQKKLKSEDRIKVPLQLLNFFLILYLVFKIPTVENASSVNLPASVLTEAITKTIFAVSSDELRPAMTGVYCQLSEQHITFVATDAHKLVRYRRMDSKGDKASSFILPKKALTLLKAALPSTDANVSVDYNATSAFFKFENINLVCRLIDERYPDYEAVIPANNPNKLIIDRALFLNTLRRVVIFANKTTHQVRLKINGSELNISSEDLDFANEAHERLSCQYEGEDLEIGFNARFLIEMLSNLSGEEVTLELSTPNRAGLLIPQTNDENEDVLMLVMPVMLNNYN
jgi:DNA polymerase-3 subunit beta